MSSDDFPGYVRTRRMKEQQWLLDASIRVIGVDWDQGRTRSALNPCGLDAQADFQRVRDRVKKFSDIHREFAAAGRRREQLAQDARQRGSLVELREHSFIASVLWGNAEWPLFGHSPLAKEYSDHKLACFGLYMDSAAYRVRRIEVPFNGGALPGYLHLPTAGEGPYPCVVAIGGMDGFKEKRVAMYGDKYLERGIAQLVIEIPGQGEALARGLVFTEDSIADAARAITRWIPHETDIDQARVAIAGSSFGSFWATGLAANTDIFVGCGVAGVIHEPGMESIFERASPTFKARFMHMCGYQDEDAFDRFAANLDPRPFADTLQCPYQVVAGEDDELSPIEHTFTLLERMKVPRELVLYEGEKHSVGGGSASALGPNRNHLVAGWFADRLAGHPAQERYTYIDTSGRAHERPPPW